MSQLIFIHFSYTQVNIFINPFLNIIFLCSHDTYRLFCFYCDILLSGRNCTSIAFRHVSATLVKPTVLVCDIVGSTFTFHPFLPCSELQGTFLAPVEVPVSVRLINFYHMTTTLVKPTVLLCGIVG